MHDEISFLLEISDNHSGVGSISNYSITQDNKDLYKKNTVTVKVNNKKVNKDKIINTLLDTSYDQKNSNPYTDIIEKFSDENYPHMSISAADLAYLTELGVYPINRLVILRRYPENIIVPHNLNDLVGSNVKPLSTVIGWIDPEDEKMLSISFKEKWVTTTDMFWDVVNDIIKKDTGISLSKTMALPSWGQGFVFNFLTHAGYIDKNTKQENFFPIGDPDVLKEASTRESDNQGIDTSFSFTLKTSYEQKYINNIDPGSAMLDIINNVLKMGISDMRFMLGGKAKDIMNTINSSKNEQTKEWMKTIGTLAKDFLNTIKGMYDGNRKAIIPNILDMSVDAINDALFRFRWPLKGSLGLMTGQNTTPWHLTIGNPLNPIISSANMIVDGDMDFGNEIGFNDMPTKINVSFNVKLGRPLGKSELIDILDNTYGRTYSSIEDMATSSSSQKNTNTTSTTKNNTNNNQQGYGYNYKDYPNGIPYDYNSNTDNSYKSYESVYNPFTDQTRKGNVLDDINKKP